MHFSSPLTTLFAVCLLLFGFSAGPTSSAVAQSDSRNNAYVDDTYVDEMYDDDTYGSEMYGRSRGSDGGPISVYLDPLTAIFKSLDLKPIFASDIKIDVRTGPALEMQAKEVFLAGNHALACKLLHGHIAAEYDQASPALAKVKLSKLLKRPIWNLRWAISMAVRGADDVSDPSPIGSGASSHYLNDGMAMDFRSSRQPDRADFMDDPMDDGLMMGMKKQTAVEEIPSMLSDDAAEQLAKNLGGVAEAFATEFEKRFAAGDFGTIFQAEPNVVDESDSMALLPGLKQPPNASRPRPLSHRSPGRNSSDDHAPTIRKPVAELISNVPPPLPMWRPGIVFLGVGPSSEIIETAKAEKIDLLIHFDVVLKSQGRQNQTSVQNVSRARLIHVSKGKSLIVSKAMDSSEVQQMQSAGRLSDPRSYIDEQMSALWRLVDRDIKLVELPNLSPESARRRISSLLERAGVRNLRSLAEVRLYQSLGLITEEEANKAYHMIGGSDALTMMHGPRDERLEMAKTWTIESFNQAEEN
jgi:hypothetical protein